jgi:hypothetical protein
MNSFAQYYQSYEINFDDPDQFFRIDIDTLTNPNNTWQIGPPQKSTFSSAFSVPNAMVTDTINPYPNNNISQFTITHLAQGGFVGMAFAVLSCQYRVNSDTLTDYGSIEFSPDNGTTWVNLLTDTIYYNLGCYNWYSEKPVLSGYSNGWKDFYCSLAGFGYHFNIQYDDTVLYRFTFTSDAFQSYKDGLMFDNLNFEDWVEGIDDLNQSEAVIDIFPVPALESVSIAYDNALMQNHQLLIFDEVGKLMHNQNMQKSNSLILDLSKWESGNYFIRLNNTETKQSSTGKFIKVN